MVQTGAQFPIQHCLHDKASLVSSFDVK